MASVAAVSDTTATARATAAGGTPVPKSGARFGWLFAVIWLVYLANPLSVLVDDAAGWRRVVGLLGLAGFLASWLVGLAHFRRLRLAGGTAEPWRSWLVLSALAVCLTLMVPGAGEAALTAAPFIVAMMVMCLRQVAAMVGAGTVLIATEVSSHLVPGWHDQGYGFGVLLAGVATWSFRLAWQRNQALLAAQDEIAALALEEERSRIAADLHDILGHSLTVITVKAELAQRLLDVDLERTRSELVDLEMLSRDALADVRATALGVRGVSLLGEIAQARSALESAGIDASLPTVADEVPSRWRELFAWTVRECVTNVIRHSRARTCVVEMSSVCLRVCDDGVGMLPGREPQGQGLGGLRRRVELAGATLQTGPGPDGRGVEVLVKVPA
jgi:two-component system, NarL family, sensor histidine kinase DesK